MHFYLSDFIRLSIMVVTGVGLFYWIKMIASVYIINKVLTPWQFVKKFVNLFCWIAVCLSFIMGQIANYGVPIKWNSYIALVCSFLIIVAAKNYDRITSMHLKEIVEDSSKSSYDAARKQLEKLRADTQSILEKTERDGRGKR